MKRHTTRHVRSLMIDARKEVNSLLKALRIDSLPTPLATIAATRNIRQVSFRPLLVLGCLEVKGNDFCVNVFCTPSEASRYALSWTHEEGQASLPGRVRFTIAHEIAHTFFFDNTTTPPTDLLASDDAKGLDEIEYCCEEIAAEVLLPTAVLHRKATEKDCNLMDPNSVRRLVRAAGVSARALVIQCQQNTDWFHDDGGICCVENIADGFRISAIALSPALHGPQGIFAGIRRGVPLRALIRNPHFVLNGGTESKVTSFVNYSTHRSTGFRRFEFTCEETLRPRREYLVTLRATAAPFVV